jgi:glycosidase
MKFYHLMLLFIISDISSANKILTNKKDVEWWKKSIIYQIYPRSFKDSNNDGIGDLKGVISKLDYLLFIGVNAIWLNPIYTSGSKDNGYDITSFVDIDPIFGTMEDFDELIKKCHQKGITYITFL